MSTLYQTDFSTDFSGNWGPDWTRLQGNSALNVTSGQATAANGGTGNVIVAGSSSTDFDVTVTLTQTTNTDIIGPMARVVDASNFYYLDIGAFGNTLTFGKRVGGSFTDLVLQPFSYTTGVAYTLRLQVIGTACKGKAWLATDPEPGSWLIDTTDSSISSAGQAGIFAFCPSVAASLFDDFLATDGATGVDAIINEPGQSSAADTSFLASRSSKAGQSSGVDGSLIAVAHQMPGSSSSAGSGVLDFIETDAGLAAGFDQTIMIGAAVVLEPGNATATDESSVNEPSNVATVYQIGTGCDGGLATGTGRDGALLIGKGA